MRFLHYDRFIIDTPMNLEQAILVIKQNLPPKLKWYEIRFRIKGNLKGTVTAEGFKITRILRYYSNSFVPIVIGKFERLPIGTRIYIKMRLHLFVIGFLFIWFGILIIGFILFISKSIQTNEIDTGIYFISGMILFGY